MKTKKYATVFAVAVAVMAMTGGCGSPDNVSNNLGGATRDNSAYRYNYDYSGGDMGDGWTKGTYGMDTNRNAGAAYWDYYGTSNGSANDSVTGLYSDSNRTTGNNSAYGTGTVYGTPSNNAAVANNTSMNSAALAD